jgi:hypothetical protein
MQATWPAEVLRDMGWGDKVPANGTGFGRCVERPRKNSGKSLPFLRPVHWYLDSKYSEI